MAHRRLAHDMIDVFGARTAVALLGTVTGIVLARTLGPHDRGILALVLLLPSTLVTLAKFGLTQANVYCVRREGASIEQVAANSLALAVVLGVGIGAVAWWFRGLLLSTIMREVPAWALLLALWRLPLLLIDNFFCGVLQAINNFSLYNRRTVFGAAAVLVLVVGLRVALRLDLFSSVLVYTIVTTVVVGALVIGTRRLVPFGLWLDRRLLKRQMRFGMKSYTQILATHLLFRIDVYMVAYFLNPAQTAFYSLALHFTEMILEIPQAVGWVIYPRLASLSKDEVHRLTAQACRRTVLLTGLGGLVVIAFGPLMVPLWYGKAFAAASKPLAFATLGMVMMSVFTILTRDFTSRNNQGVNIRAGTAALVTNVILNVFMIPTLGISGAALATSISYSLAAIMVMVAYRRESGIALTEVLIPRLEDARFVYDVTVQAAMRRMRRTPAPLKSALPLASEPPPPPLNGQIDR
ncbi:MAG TPA: oligosaccharide flippase family protein [Candidatus Binatia bacterium]